VGHKNILELWVNRSKEDHDEGLLAYSRYNWVMEAFADYYGYTLQEATEVFVALSPNSDYHGNLRSLASVLDGHSKTLKPEQITVSTYNACKNRAISYLNGVSFLDTVKGPKISAFRHNILNPQSSDMVTVDGHMIHAWHGTKGTMKDAAAKMRGKKDYLEIADGLKLIAKSLQIAPCQLQAILWLARKRILGIKSDDQLELFRALDDTHRTICDPRDYPPYQIKDI